MLVKEFLYNLRNKISDVDAIEYSDDELIRYLNDSIDALTIILSKYNKSDSVKDLDIQENTEVPKDFYELAGQYPLQIKNNKFHILNSCNNISIRYIANKPRVYLITDEIPTKEIYISLLLQLSSIFALNRNEYDIEQDKSLFSDIVSNVAGDN